MFYLIVNSTHFMYGYMVEDHSNIKKKPAADYMSYSFQLAVRDLLCYKKDSTYHGLVYTS